MAKSIPTDRNQLAKYIVDMSTREETPPEPVKNPAAVALGRLGGLKGGKARAKSLQQKSGRKLPYGQLLRDGIRIKLFSWRRGRLRNVFYNSDSRMVFDNFEGWRIHQ